MDIRKLRGLSFDVQRQEQYQQYLRDKERENQIKKQQERQKQETQKKAQQIINEGREAEDTLKRLEQEPVVTGTLNQNVLQRQKNEDSNALQPWVSKQPDKYNLIKPIDEQYRPFAQDGKIKPYDWSRSSSKTQMDYSPAVKSIINNSKKLDKINNYRYSTAPARISYLISQQQDLQEAVDAMGTTDSVYRHDLMEQLQYVKNKINKEVEWYDATTPKDDYSIEDQMALSAFQGMLPGYPKNPKYNTTDKIVREYEKQMTGKVSPGQNLLADAHHTFMVSKNRVQQQTSLGKIQTLQQQLNLANPQGLDEYEKICNDYIQINRFVNDIKNRYVSGKGITKEERKAWDDSEKKLEELNKQKQDYERTFDDLRSFQNNTVVGNIVSDAQKYLNKLNLDFGTGVGSSLKGYSQNMYAFQKALADGDTKAARLYKEKLKNIFSKFSTSAKQMQKLWQKDYDIDTEDLKKYTNYKVSEYYKLKEQAANPMAWYNPQKLWMAPSLLGSSLSSPEKTAMSIGAGLTAMGGMLLAPETAGTSIALTAGAVSFLSSMAAGADENFANVADATDEIAKQDLKKNNQSVKFLSDAKKVLGNNIEIDDALHAFYRGQYVPSDFKIRRTLLDATAGSAKQYYQGMGVNTFDSLVDAMVACMPMGGIAKTSKVGFLFDKAASKIDRKLFKAQLAKYMKENNVSLKEAVKILNENGNGAALENFLTKFRSTVNAPADYVRSLTKEVAEDIGLPKLTQKASALYDKALAKMAEKSLSHTANTVDMISAIPEKVLRYRRNIAFAGKVAKDLGWRTAASMYSEGAEEGLQQLQQYQRIEERSNAYYNVLNQLPLTIIDGAKLWATMLFKDPEKLTAQERDIIEQMHGGILGALLQGGPNIAVSSATGAYKQYKMDHIIMNNLFADNIAVNDLIDKGTLFSRMIRGGKIGQLNDFINQYENIANQMKENHKDDASWGIPSDHVSNLRKLVNTIGNLQLNENVKNHARELFGIDSDTDTVKHNWFTRDGIKNRKLREQNKKDYDTYLGLLAARLNEVNDSKSFLDEKTKNLIQERFNYSKSFEDFINQNQADPLVSELSTKIEKDENGQYKLSDKYKDDDDLKKKFQQLQDNYTKYNSNAEFLHDLIGQMQTMQLFQDINQIKNVTGGKSLAAKIKFDIERSKKRLQELYGKNVKLDTEQDVRDFAQQQGFDISEDYVNALRQRSEAALQLNFNTELFNRLLTSKNDIKRELESFKTNRKENEALRQSIEDDFYNNELDREKFVSSEVKDDNNTFVKDGKTYVVRDDVDGVRRVYEYDSENDKLLPTNKQYSKSEWYYQRQMFDEDGIEHEKMRAKYDDYQSLISRDKDSLTEEEKKRLDTYKSTMLDEFARFEEADKERNKYIEDAKKSPGLSITSDVFDNINQYAQYAQLTQDQYDNTINSLVQYSDNGYSTIEETLRNKANSRSLMLTRDEDGNYYVDGKKVDYYTYKYAAYLNTHPQSNPDNTENDQQDDTETPDQNAGEGDNTQEQQPGQDPQLEPEQPAEDPHPITTGSQMTEQQKAAKSKIEQYSAANPKFHYEWRTGENYFIEENGVVRMYKRLHSILQPQFKDEESKIIAIKKNAKRLQEKRDVWLNAIDNRKTDAEIEALKNKYVKEIKALKDEYYNIAVRLYGDNNIYSDRANINIDGYLQSDDILKDDDTINALAKLFAHDGDNLFEPFASVISGSIVDDIARRVFGHIDIQYEQEPDISKYMSEKAFDKLVKDLTARREELEKAGFVLITEPICWHGELLDKNGKSQGLVAGETDMLAIAPDGSVTIIDYKTSKRSFKINEVPSPNGTTTTYVEAFDKQYSKRYAFGQRQMLTAREGYTNQLNAYRQLITQQTGLSVGTIEIMGITTNISDDRNKVMLSEIKSTRVPVTISVAIIDPMYNHQSFVEQRAIIDQAVLDLKDKISNSIQPIVKKFQDLQKLVEGIEDQDILQSVKLIKIKLDTIYNSYKNTDSLSTLQQYDKDMDLLNQAITSAEEHINEYIANRQQPGNDQSVTPNSEKFKAPHRIYDDSELQNYNHTDQDPKWLNDEQKKRLQKFKDWTTQKDFVENVIFEIDFDTSGFIKGVATMGQHLKFKSISYKGEQLPADVVSFIGMKMVVDNDPTSLRNKLIQYFNENYDDIKSGKKRVVLNNVSRTNGKLIFGKQFGNVKDKLSLSDEQISGLLDYNNSTIILVSDKSGILRRLDSDDMKVGSGTAHRVAKKQQNKNRPGIVYVEMDLGYTEDEDSDYQHHTQLIPLTPSKLSKSAVQFIVSVLTSKGKGKNAQAIDNNGNTIEGPISKTMLLHYLIRFGGGAESVGNNFQFNYVSNDSGLDYSKVQISNDGGQTNTVYDLTNTEDVAKLGQWLSDNAYLNIQNTLMLRDNLKQSNGIFKDVKEWFDNHPEISSIKYSDEFVITRDDVNNGARGIEWMIKNNWVQSQYEGITDAIVSASDFSVIDNNEKPVDQKQLQQRVEEQFGNIGQNPTQTQTTETTSGEISFDEGMSAWDDLMNSGLDMKDDANIEPVMRINSKEQMEKAVADVRRMCGDTVLINTISELERKQLYGDVVGQCTASSIMLSYGAENGVQYHEAFHRVVELLIPSKERELLYNIYKNKYAKNKSITDRQIAEGLADLYFHYSKRVWHPKLKFFDRVFGWVYNYINALLTTKNFKYAVTFAKIDYGKYANREVLTEANHRFNRKFKRLNMTMLDQNGNNVDFDHIYTRTQLNETVEVLLPLIIRTQGIDILGSNIENLNTSKQYLLDPKNGFYNYYNKLTFGNLTEEQLNEAVASGKISSLVRDNALILREAFKNWNVTQQLIENKLASWGVRVKLENEDKNKENKDSDQTNQVSTDIDNHSDEFYSHSMSDDIAASMVYLFSTIPSQRYVTQEDVAQGIAKSMYVLDKDSKIVIENGKPKRATIPATRNSLGMTTYMPFKSVHQRLLTELHDIKNVKDLLERLKKLGENDYLFNYLYKQLDTFRYLSYVRYNNGQYAGFPMVMCNKKTLDPAYYISDTSIKDDNALHPLQVKLVRDFVVDGKLVCKAGDILNGAYFVQDQDKQTLTTQFFQAIKTQKMNFNFLSINNAQDISTGRYSYSYRPTNTDRSVSQFPINWFDNIRRGFTGLYDKNGNIDKTNKTFENTRQFLLSVRNQLINTPTTIKIGTETYNMNDVSDFDSVVSFVITSLNNVGIMINKPAWYNMLHRINPNSTDYTIAFRELMTASNAAGLSIATFIEDGGILDKLQKGVESGNINLFTNDIQVKGNKDAYSGAYLYARNSFVSRLAAETGIYRSMSQELMTIGPNNTKMYMYAQNNTVSDITDDLNDSLNDDGSVKNGSVLNDLQNVEYVVFRDSEGQLHGSVIAKQLLDPSFNPNHNKLVVETEGGSKTQVGDRSSVKFSEMQKREDYLSRIQKLTDGFIIFHTLSDKSTYMSIRGFKLPGLDYSVVISNTSTKDTLSRFGQLPYFAKTNGVLMFSQQDKIDNYQYNEVLDQFIEYFEAEHRNVLKTLKELGYGPNGKVDALPKEQLVVNYHTKNRNGARYTSLAGIYDENGNFISFNYKTDSEDGGIVACNKDAEDKFFNKPIGEKRAIVARILQHRLDDELNALKEAGIIETIVNDNTAAPGAEYSNYKNKYLSSNIINKLKNAYIADKIASGITRNINSESMAVVAYVFDTMCKSLMSSEETRRFYTGMPQFFKTSYGKDGNLTVFGNDETKRFGGLGSTGTNNRDDIPGINEDYTVAEIEDWETPSVLEDSLKDIFQKGEYREAVANIKLSELSNASQIEDLDVEKERIYKDVYNMSDDELRQILKENDVLDTLDAKIQKEAKAFSNVNVADGTAFISDKMCENLLKQRGAFTSKVEKAFNILRSDNQDYLKSAESYKIIHEALISTQKYSAFGYRMENGIPVHYYNKYALFPVFKGISYGFMKNLYEKMNDSENGVDMVMFTSAVKAGSRGAQRFNPEMSAEEMQNFSFKDHIYKQKYKYLRRQLNTDPRTDEIMAAGTQALKVVLSTLRDGQTYRIKNSSGEVVDMQAYEVRDRVMGLMNDIADNNWEQLKDKFFDTVDGQTVINYKKLQQFLIDQFSSRDADQNLIDGLILKEDGSGFDVDLNSVLNMSWVESILTSEVNKNVIDVRFKGNAFYQRSVFGMDSPYITVSENAVSNKLNGGKSLQMINEEGSMDAVISIDYFMDIIPKGLQHNFLKAKQWLIDNGIISGVKTGETEWSNAEANTMSYRIPTQAMSSIGALRFVDVLPIVRDTIVLPKEFTAQTGSDFDIDKLYMSTLYYDIDEHEEERTNKKGEKYTTKISTAQSTELKDETKNKCNELLRTYLQLLKDAGVNNNGKIENARYAQILRRSIDSDTGLIKDVLNEIESDIQEKTYEPYKYECLSNQVDIRSQFATGKVGIGPFALNNNNQILTQIYNVSFKDDGGILSKFGTLSLARNTDFDGNSILSWISGYINAHVDVAKDSYILRLNVNKDTYNICSLLTRLGFGKHTLYFLNNPVIKDIAKLRNECNGQVVDDPGKSPTRRKEDAEKQYIKEKFGESSIAYAYLISKAEEMLGLFDQIGDTIVKMFGDFTKNHTKDKTIVQQIATNPNKDTVFEIDGKKYTTREVQEYMYIALKEFEKYAQALSDLVQYTKIDTKKQGINYQDQQNYLEKYNDLKESEFFNDNLQRLLEDSYIQKKTEYGTSFLKDAMGDLIINMSDGFVTQLDKILDNINNHTNETKSAVQQAMQCYIKQKCFNAAFRDYIERYNKENGTNLTIEEYWNNLITGNNTLSSRIQRIQRFIQSDRNGVLKEFGQNGVITNKILANIYPISYIAQYGQDHYDVLSLGTNTEDDSTLGNDYIYSWQQLFDYKNEKNPKLQKFINDLANDLAIYAFMTSADSKGFTKFFKYVPLSWRKSFGYCDYVAKAHEQYKDGSVFDMFDNSDLGINYDDFIKNFYYDDRIIPTTRIKNNNGEYMMLVSKFSYDRADSLGQHTLSTEPKNIIGLHMRRGQADVAISKNKNGEFPRFIKTKREGIALNNDIYMLYQLVGTGFIKNKDNVEIEYPIYQLINPKGMQLRIGAQTYYFYSCGMEDSYNRQYFLAKDKAGNRVRPSSEDVQRIFEQRRKTLVDYVTNQHLSIDDAIKKSGFISKSDLLANQLSKLQREGYGGIVSKERLLKSLNDQLQNNNQKIPVVKHVGTWSRKEVENNPDVLYVFTDNTDRNSGSSLISDDSWYSKKYGKGKHYPNITAAVIRGLENARPISTQRYYHNGAKGPSGNWKDSDFVEFKNVIMQELQDIVDEFNTGKYKYIMFPSGDSLFNTKISNITKERTPLLYNMLANMLHEFGFDNLIPEDVNINQNTTEQIKKSLKDYPENDSLDELADEIDEHCKHV